MANSVFIPGVPVAQGSKRHVGRGIMIEASKKLPAWRKTMSLHLREWWGGRDPINEPVVIEATFCVPRPKTVKRLLPAVAPDLDKYQRALGDALTEAGVLADDSRITTWHATKRYSAEPGVHITIRKDTP